MNESHHITSHGDLSYHGGNCRVESHHITSHHMETSRISRRNDVDLRGTIARIATGDHMSSKHSRISIGGSRSGAGEFSCRNLSSHHTRTHANGGFSPLIVSYRSPRMKQPFFSVNNHSSAQNSKAQHTSQTNEFL